MACLSSSTWYGLATLAGGEADMLPYLIWTRSNSDWCRNVPERSLWGQRMTKSSDKPAKSFLSVRRKSSFQCFDRISRQIQSFVYIFAKLLWFHEKNVRKCNTVFYIGGAATTITNLHPLIVAPSIELVFCIGWDRINKGVCGSLEHTNSRAFFLWVPAGLCSSSSMLVGVGLLTSVRSTFCPVTISSRM